jgi:MFS superfamily sulfate permease-like transporter
MAVLAALLWAASVDRAPRQNPPERKGSSVHGDGDDSGLLAVVVGGGSSSSSSGGGSNEAQGGLAWGPQLLWRGRAGIAWAWAGLRLLPRSFAVPALLAASALAFHAVRIALGQTTAEATAAGWLFAWPDDEVQRTPRFWTWASLAWAGNVRWGLMVSTCWPYWATAAVIGVLKLAIKAGAFSTIFHKDIAADRELILLGVLNAACGLLGCSGIHWSFANTNLAHELGGSQKGGGLVYAACFAVLWVTGLGPLRLVPVFVYAALLCDVGRTFVDAHLVKPLGVYRSRSDRAVLVVVVSVFVGVDMLAGLAVGVLLSLLLLVAQLHAHGTVTTPRAPEKLCATPYPNNLNSRTTPHEPNFES